MTQLLVVEQLAVRRGSRTIFKDLSLAVDRGEIVGVVGRNGCGKSTLLASIAGILEPRDGTVHIDGANVWGDHTDRTRARRALGYVPEAADPPGFLTGAELWALCAATRGSEPPAAALVDALGLDELVSIALDKMSLGQRRRACLAAALVGAPPLLVLDEPDNGLDMARLDALVSLVTAHVRADGACVLASHDAALLERLRARPFSLDR